MEDLWIDLHQLQSRGKKVENRKVKILRISFSLRVMLNLVVLSTMPWHIWSLKMHNKARKTRNSCSKNWIIPVLGVKRKHQLAKMNSLIVYSMDLETVQLNIMVACQATCIHNTPPKVLLVLDQVQEQATQTPSATSNQNPSITRPAII